MLVPKYCLNEITDVFGKELIRSMLHKDPNQRPTIKQVQKSPFFWTNKQRIDHVKFILRGPKAQAVNKKVRILSILKIQSYFVIVEYATINPECWPLR